MRHKMPLFKNGLKELNGTAFSFHFWTYVKSYESHAAAYSISTTIQRRDNYLIKW